MKSRVNSILILILLVLLPQKGFTSWLCRETSSVSQGNTITACGVGSSSQLEEARVKSRENAVEEFKRVCQLSEYCRDNDYNVIPKRTECEFKDNVHTCYRAMEFEVINKRKDSITLDLNQLQANLKAKNAELQEIEKQIKIINDYKNAESEATRTKVELNQLKSTLEIKEAEVLKLEDLSSPETINSNQYKYFHQLYKNSVKVSFHYWDSELTDTSEKDFKWLAAYEHRPMSWLGLQLYGGFGMGHLSDQKRKSEDVPTQGTPNTTKNYNGKVAYTDIGIGVLMYSGWNGTYLKLDSGYLWGKQEEHSIDYNGSGVGTVTTIKDSFDTPYLGLSLGFDTRDDKKGWGMFIELGARKTKDNSSPSFIGGIGINYGY